MLTKNSRVSVSYRLNRKKINNAVTIELISLSTLEYTIFKNQRLSNLAVVKPERIDFLKERAYIKTLQINYKQTRAEIGKYHNKLRPL